MYRFISFVAVVLMAQTHFSQTVASFGRAEPDDKRLLYTSIIGNYRSQTAGLSLAEIVRRAFANNGEIKIARLEVEKAQARLQQAQLRPNPTLEVEQSTGSFVGSPGDRELSVGVSVPLEVYGQRNRRIDLAKAEIILKEAEVAAKQRELAGQIFETYAEALANLREVQVLEELLDLDARTVQFVQIRVNEGETAPLELNLLQTEVERIRSRRQLTEGKLQAALSKLKFYAGLTYEEPLKLVEDISIATVPSLPPTIETSIGVGLKNRPEIRLAELDEQLANAGLRLIRSQSKPDISATARYTQGRAGFDDPRGEFFQKDRSLTFGISIGLPVFNRNQGAKAEAAIAIRQAQERRAFSEQVVKNEIITAFGRIEAARRALTTLETAVLPRSRENIDTIRKVYEIGELKITDLIAEQRKLLEANRDLTETLTERYRAQADLFIALGLTLEK
ncbi:MAG: TolC family protein [Pyrinomonadaceae bacterium]|nr:TolC family protein [Pyrinomonadaceae bacterium]